MDDNDLKAGLLQVKEVKKWKEYYCVLSGNTLHWYKSQPKDPKKKGKSKGSVALPGAVVKPPEVVDGQTYAVQIVRSDSLFAIAAKNEEEGRDWFAVLQSAATGGKDLKETVQIQEELRKNTMEIPSEELEFIDEVIGAGASGIVKRGLWLKSTEVAVKALKNVPEFTDSKELLTFFKEIETLSKLRHVNIVQMYGFCKKNNYICLITEYVRGGNLADCLRDRINYPLDFSLQIELSLNICRGMVFLHNKGVIHRDLKPANILIENWGEGRVKVCDFGLSKMARKTDEDAPSETLGSPQYAAPDLSKDNHTDKVDVFSFSIILWEIAYKTQPWQEVKFGWEFAERYTKGLRPALSDNPFRNLIAKCWDQDPNARPSFAQIFSELENLKNSTLRQLAGVSPPRGPAHSVGRQPSSWSSFPVMTNPSGKGVALPGLTTGRAQSPPPLPRHGSHTPKLISSPSFPNLAAAPPPTAPASPGVELLVSKLFADKPTETWPTFAAALGAALSTSASNIQRIQYVFDVNGIVEKSLWDQFLVWFSPLSPQNLYNTNDDASGGYTIDDILAICTPGWFHAFLSSADAQRELKGKSDGTFLFRFSTSNPGCYALSASYSGTVGHWRISCSRDGHQARYKIDGREYSSLNEIITVHRAGGEPLKIKQPKPGQASACFLGAPLIRTAVQQETETESHYMNSKRA